MVSLQNVNIHFQLKLIKKRLLCLFLILILLPVSIQDINYNTQWNQGTGKIGSLHRGFVISRFFFIHNTISGLKNMDCYAENFVTQ